MHTVFGEREIFISTVLAKRPERRLALTVVLLSFAIFIGMIPFARLPLPQVWAFMPIYESALIISDLHRNAVLYAGLWLVLRLGGFPRNVGEDGLLSVRRGWHVDELESIARKAGIAEAKVWLYFGARVLLGAARD